MPDRDVATIRDLIYYQYAKIVAKSAFAASDGESSLKLRDDKKFYDSIPPLRSGAFDNGDLDGDDMVTALDIDAVIG
jgi:hypothetical protein